MHLREVCGISASCFKLVFLLVQDNDGTSNLETAIVLSDMDGFTVVQEDIASQLGNSSQTLTFAHTFVIVGMYTCQCIVAKPISTFPKRASLHSSVILQNAATDTHNSSLQRLNTFVGLVIGQLCILLLNAV